jgi:hypothetical protein
MAPAQIRRLRRVSLSAVGVGVLCATTALAVTGNTVNVHKPLNARVGTPYRIKITGFATGHKALYAFLDYHNCRSTPAAEHHRANGYIWAVSGAYSEATNGNTPNPGMDHICAYLVKASAPRNPATGVVAHDFVTFTVH